MSDTTVREQVRSLLEDTADALAGTGKEHKLEAMAANLDRPLRVAIAGRVKAGKSTLLNALVGERVAATDAGECTRIVTWYSDGLAYRAWVHPVDGEPRQVRFRRDEGETIPDLSGEDPSQIARMTVEFPSRQLRQLTVIDTPGMGSLSTDVSERSVKFLTGDSDGTDSADGLDDGDSADAVLYLMRHLHATDVNFLEAFHDAEFSAATPVNAIGVLSRADEVGAGRTDSLDLARRIAGQYQTDSRVRSLVQTVVPVAGLLAESAVTLRQREYRLFEKLAAMPLDQSGALLLSADRVADPDGPTDPSADDRQALLDRFGLYGVRLSVALIQHGLVGGATELADELFQRSGLPELRDLILSHFGDRADVLKARAALAAVDHALAAHPVASADELKRRQEQIKAGTHDFEELRLLNDLRCGLVSVPADQQEEMERLLGALGRAVPARLGLQSDTPVDVLREAALAELDRWQRTAESPIAPGELRKAAAVLRRSCEGIYVDTMGPVGEQLEPTGAAASPLAREA